MVSQVPSPRPTRRPGLRESKKLLIQFGFNVNIEASEQILNW